MARNVTGRRFLYLTSYPSTVGRDALRGSRLVESFMDSGWTQLIRNFFVDDRLTAIVRRPSNREDFTDESEFRQFSPDLVIAEGGLYHQGGSDWKFPLSLALSFVELGGVFLALDNGFNTFLDGSPLARELGFFGAYLPSQHHVPYLQDTESNDGGARQIVCRPHRLSVSAWLADAFEGVDRIVASLPVPLVPTDGDIAASAEPTAQTLELDVFSDTHSFPSPFATVRQHGNGFAGIVAAQVTADDLTRNNPGNILWLRNLATLLVDTAGHNKRLRPRSMPPAWTGDPRPTVGLVDRDEDDTFEIKETARFNVHKGDKGDEITDEVVEAVQELWNKDGGVVLVGIKDSPREIRGIERDLPFVKPKSADGLCLFISDRLGHKLGGLVPIQVLVRTEMVDDKEILRIDVPRGAQPAWRDGKHLRVRRQNGGMDLHGPDVVAYLQQRFP